MTVLVIMEKEKLPPIKAPLSPTPAGKGLLSPNSFPSSPVQRGSLSPQRSPLPAIGEHGRSLSLVGGDNSCLQGSRDSLGDVGLPNL